MKKIFAILFASFFSLTIFAGDVAFFVDIGFSQDGKYYLFGTYGKIDKKYQPWAEIYTVDVKENIFVKSDVFKTNPGDIKSEISGKCAYEELKEKSAWKIAKYCAKPSPVQNLLYVRDGSKKSPTEEIIVKDFESSTEENSVFYHIKLVPSFFGTGKNCKSRFRILLSRVNQNGTILSSQIVGTPDFERKGITAYQIDKIFTDKSGKSLVFVIQKTLEDETGISIRYMVETTMIF